jgi:hypothetical protein
MMHLREIVGDTPNQMPQTDTSITLDERTITQDELDKKRQDKSTRIIETNPGNFKTLHKLNG